MEDKFFKAAIFFCSFFLMFFCFSQTAARAQTAGSTIVEATDSDHDGLSDNDEINIYHTDPNLWDTDGDGYGDGDEVWNGYSPLSAGDNKMGRLDSDNDGLTDALEVALGTDLKNPDTDGDGFSDGAEVFTGYDPLAAGKARETDKRAEVDLTNQRMDYYFKGIKIGTILVSTGKAPLLTPTGDFNILRKRPTVNYGGATYSYPNTKWNLEFKKGFYIHGAYWHNMFGKKSMSHGCVNVAYKDMEKFYSFMDIGSPVKIFGTTPAGLIKVNN